MFSREGWANRRPANTRLMAAPAVRATPVMPAATDHSSGRTIAPKCAGNGSLHAHGKEAVRHLDPTGRGREILPNMNTPSSTNCVALAREWLATLGCAQREGGQALDQRVGRTGRALATGSNRVLGAGQHETWKTRVYVSVATRPRFGPGRIPKYRISGL